MIVTKTDPVKLEAFAEFRRKGWGCDAVCRALGISRATYFRRLAELKLIEAQVKHRQEVDA